MVFAEGHRRVCVRRRVVEEVNVFKNVFAPILSTLPYLRVSLQLIQISAVLLASSTSVTTRHNRSKLRQLRLPLPCKAKLK